MKLLVFYILSVLTTCSFAQDNVSELLEKYNTKQVPYITVEELAMPKTEAIILDAREPHEYEVSHLQNAVCVGYDDFDIETIISQIPNKEQDIVVYCSLGIRSEVIANKLQNAGYLNVRNLYGGIFEWKNKEFSVYNTQKKETDSVHVFSKEWSKWLIKGIKVYE